MKIKEILSEEAMSEVLMMSGSTVVKKTVPHANLNNMEVHGYQVIDNDGSFVGKPLKSRIRARRKVDKLDDQYGGVRYHQSPVYVETN